jgi:hypothetical protein
MVLFHVKPTSGNNFLEILHLWPEGLEVESGFPSERNIGGHHDRTVIRQRGGEGLQKTFFFEVKMV